MSVYESLSLMNQSEMRIIASLTFVVMLLTYLQNRK